MRTSLLALIRLYQLTISRLLGPRCRFYPSCSQYAAEAIHEARVVPWFRARACARAGRCHPWHPGGVDLVPDRVPSSLER